MSENPENPHIEYPFDHAVINVRDALDEAVTIFTRLGFRVTPRGFHTLGSINHLIVFGTTYIELIGFPSNSASVRAELSVAKAGLNGLVFRTQNAQVSGEQARARGAPVGDAQQFSRPVDLRDDADTAKAGNSDHDSEHWPDAVFRTARAEPGFGPGGRLYFCEHLTPELVWREPWRAHPNAALELSLVRIESIDLPKTARQFSELLGARSVRRDGATALISAAPVLIEVRDGAREFMRGVQIKVSSLARTRAYLSQRVVPFTEQPATANSGALLRVAAEQAGCVEFEFSEA